MGKQDNDGFAYYGEDKYYQATHQDEFKEEVKPDMVITSSELDKLLGDDFSNNKTRLLTGRMAFKKLCERDLISKKKEKEVIKFN